MKSKHSTDDELVYLSLQPAVLTKADRARLAIVKSAIVVFAEQGLENASYARIATRAKVSRNLIIHYFPKKADLFQMCARFVRADMQALAVASLGQASRADEMLRKYVRACFIWMERDPLYNRFWLLVFAVAGQNEKFRKFHTELVDVGEARIQKLLEKGIQEKVFRSGPDLRARAKQIQAIITGVLTNMFTETTGSFPKDFPSVIENLCLHCAGWEPGSKRLP